MSKIQAHFTDKATAEKARAALVAAGVAASRIHIWNNIAGGAPFAANREDATEGGAILGGALGLRAKSSRRFKATTNSKHRYQVAPNLLERRFEVDGINRLWVSDITYVWTQEGWLYLAIVLDAWSRRVVGWAWSKTLEAEQNAGSGVCGAGVETSP